MTGGALRLISRMCGLPGGRFLPAAFLLSRLRGALAPKSREDDPHKAAQDELLLLVDEAEQDGGLAKEDGELLRSACGADFDPQFYVDYLTRKYTALYNL